MIEMLEGVPGSGKSYYAVSERLLKWVRAGRRIYVFVDGFYLDRLALFEGVELAVLHNGLTRFRATAPQQDAASQPELWDTSPAGPLRLFRPFQAAQMAWWLPLALRARR